MNSKNKDKILILSATFGDGHKQVAKAISEAVDYTLPDSEPVILDIMEWIHPYLYPISNYVYKRSLKKFPQLYSYIYRKTREKSSFSLKLNALFSIGMRSLLEILQELKPSVVVSTYPFAAGIMSQLKEQGLVDLPAVTIITDYTDHSYWIHPYTDQYVVGSRQVRDRLIALGIESFKIKYTGIPIRQKFLENHSREKLASKYQLDSKKFTLLIMGGGDGFIGKGLSTFRGLESLPTSIQLIIICGRNRKLYKQLEEELKDSKHDILLMGFCDHVHELMAISDLMITKPGGVTTSEAMAMELPIFIFNPLPGQEEDNAHYLLESGLAILAENDRDLISKIQSVMKDAKPLTFMKQRSRQYQSKTSSIDALEVIMRTINRVNDQDNCFLTMKMKQSM
ncbi:glycosyltransferase [Neobacillus pocheonensis]|uniref:Glycosyltransferase n=1 Tax=Neobacillus pocheonensis TaxID=363869 RepID=A0ABT0W9V6_9BACI|nr:glycosyltransferase [Neobacillus pocheonensis]